MREKEKAKRVARRDLFKLAGLGVAAGAVAIAGTKREAAAATPDAGDGSGYRETEHVKTYYELAKF